MDSSSAHILRMNELIKGKAGQSRRLPVTPNAISHRSSLTCHLGSFQKQSGFARGVPLLPNTSPLRVGNSAGKGHGSRGPLPANVLLGHTYGFQFCHLCSQNAPTPSLRAAGPVAITETTYLVICSHEKWLYPKDNKQTERGQWFTKCCTVVSRLGTWGQFYKTMNFSSI